MVRTSLPFLIILFVASAILASAPAVSPDDAKAAEDVVRAFEQAVQDFDFAKADSLTTPNARWIEESYPVPLEAWPQFFLKAKEAKLRINYHPQDFQVQVKGDVAWVTVTVNSTFTADTEGAKALLDGKSEWHPIFVESVVLVRTPQGWRIALGHTTKLPENLPK